MISPGDKVLVAVSGGPDSVCLLYLLKEMQKEFRFDLSIAHMDHMARGEESAEDARFADELGKKLGLETFIGRVDVRKENEILKTSFQEAGQQFPQVSPAAFQGAVQLIMPDGQVLTGAHAVFRVGAGQPIRGPLELAPRQRRIVTDDGGRVEISGRPVATIGRLELARTVAVVQQLPEAPAAMTVGDLVLLGRNPHLGLLGRESARDYVVAYEAMRSAGCEQLAERRLGTLSGGERRLAFLARALAQEPELLLLDEPTANLDPQAQSETFDLLRELTAGGVGALAVVHDLTLAAAYCDRVALLDRGRIVASGTPGEVLTAETVARVYGNRVTVIPHPASGAPIVVPAILENGHD